MACFLACAVIVTAFLWRDPASRTVLGNPGDADQASWWMRYAADAVAHWRLPALVSAGMNAPAGVNAMWNPSLLAPGVVLAPLTLLAGPQVSLNVMLTLGFAGSAAAMYWVLRQWGAAVPSAVLGGLAYGFSPALSQSAIGHYDLQFGVFLPLIAHAVSRLPRAPARSGVALGVLATLQLLTCEELLFETGVAIAIGLVVAGLSRLRSRPSRDTLLAAVRGALIAAGVFALLAGYPLWVQFAGPLTQHGSPYLMDFYKNDLAGFVQPSSLQLLHSQASAAFASQFAGGPAEYLGYLGWPLLFLLAWVAVALWPVLWVRVLAVTFVLLELFSLGGVLLFDGHLRSSVTLPWSYLENLPLASSVISDRFSIVADVCAAALLAIAFETLWRSGAVRRRRWAKATLAVGALVAVVPLLPAPLPTEGTEAVPAGYSAVFDSLRLPASASTLLIPVPSGAYATPMRWQADTGQPSAMVGGYFIGPASPDGQAYVGGSGLAVTPQYLDYLWLASQPVNPGVVATSTPPSPGDARSWLESSGLSAVVANTTPGTPLARYLTSLLGQPAAASGAMMAWRVPR